MGVAGLAQRKSRRRPRKNNSDPKATPTIGPDGTVRRSKRICAAACAAAKPVAGAALCEARHSHGTGLLVLYSAVYGTARLPSRAG